MWPAGGPALAQIRGVGRSFGDEPASLGSQPRRHDSHVLDDIERPRLLPFEIGRGLQPVQLVAVAPQQDEASEVPAVRPQERDLKAVNLSVLLETGVVGPSSPRRPSPLDPRGLCEPIQSR